MTVLVVGGGITGLASAYALGRAGIPTMLVERSARLGGKIRTETTDGFLIEHGPDSFVSYRPAAVQLCRELGLAGDLIRPLEPRTVYVRTRGRSLRFPDGMGLVLPTRFRPFIMSDLFSPAEKLRMALDLVLPREAAHGDVAVGPFLRHRLGAALVDRLAGPLLGGVYGTPIDELSLDAVVPQLRESERLHRSLILAILSDARARARATRTIRASGGTPPAPPPPFLALAGGTQRLIDVLEDSVRALPSVEVRTDAHVISLEIKPTTTTIVLEGGERICGEAVIIATPAPAAASLLGPAIPDAARHVLGIPHGSTTVVNLAYREDQLRDTPIGHGFIVADDEPLSIIACTLSSHKWAGRAPHGMLLVRAFIGGRRSTGAIHGEDQSEDQSERIGELAHADVAAVLGIRGRPILTRISRFPGAMPHYTVGHLERVAGMERALAPFPTIRLAGGAYHGVGLPDCIAQGQSAAQAVTAFLAGGHAVSDMSHAPGHEGDSITATPESRATSDPALHLDASPGRHGSVASPEPVRTTR